MTAVITAVELHELGTEVAVFDATVILDTARFDGDYRAASGRDQWESTRVPGAVHIDLITSLRDAAATAHFPVPSAAIVAELLAEHGVADGVPIVVYDNAGDLWAARLWWSLAAVGVDVLLLPGGVAEWVAAGFPVERGSSTTSRHPVTPRTLHSRDGYWVGKDDVLDVVAGLRPDALVCALDASSFAGTRPTRYSRRGHIPGSTNLPARGSLGADPRVDDEPVIIYCGGGISACLLAFALRENGQENVAVYSGSLEEWSADTALPLVTF